MDGRFLSQEIYELHDYTVSRVGVNRRARELAVDEHGIDLEAVGCCFAPLRDEFVPPRDGLGARVNCFARGRVRARRERAARQRAPERRLARGRVRLGNAIVELAAASRVAARHVLSTDRAVADERERFGLGRQRVFPFTRRVRRRKAGLAHGTAGVGRQAAHADLRAAAVHAARDAGAAGPAQRRERQRRLRRCWSHGERLGLGQTEKLVRRGEGRGLAERELGDGDVDERVGGDGARGVEELGGQERAL